MSQQSYEMIEGQAGRGLGPAAASEEGGLLSAGAAPQPKGRVVAACAGTLLAIALLVGCVSASPRAAARGADTAAATPMQASTTDIPSCSLMSCTSSGCAWDSAPFLCMTGSSSGGCADEASTWMTGDGCASFCDLSGCEDTLKQAGTDGKDLPRRCAKCDDDQCDKLAEQWSQACGKAAPYMCLAGSATWGCADNELAWASAPETTCGECCDVRGCDN